MASMSVEGAIRAYLDLVTGSMSCCLEHSCCCGQTLDAHEAYYSSVSIYTVVVRFEVAYYRPGVSILGV